MNKAHIITTIKKKHILVTTVIILSIVVCIGGFFIYRTHVYKAREQKVIENRNLVLPEERAIKYAMRIYHMDGHDSYLVYKLKGEPAAFLAGFSRGKYSALEKEMDDIISAVKFGGWLAPSNKIPDKYLPDWNKDYYLCCDRISSWDCCYIAFFPDSSLLFICERYYS